MGAAGQPALSAEAQAALDGQLYEAAKKGDAAAIERLAAEGASPDAKGGSYGTPAVAMAAAYGHAGAVSALVRLGADLDASGSNGWTALMAAAYYGHVECARALLAGGADRTLRATGGSQKGKTALEIAEAKGNAEVAAQLRSPAEQAAFEAWRDSLETVPTIKRLRGKAENIRAAELEKAVAKLGDGLTKKQMKAVEELSRGIVNKLLHGPMQALRSDGTDPSQVSQTLVNMHALETMFDLKNQNAPTRGRK